MQTHLRALTSTLLGALLVSACLEQPVAGRAADPGRAPGAAPWGSATSNADLEVKLELLDEFLDGKLAPAQLPARAEQAYPALSADQRKEQLQSISKLMTEAQQSGHAGMKITGLPRDMAKAELYFAERRFIEAATMLSRILDQDPIFPGARNLLARCFFFLQNRDRTIEELEYVLRHPEQGKDQAEVLDALFLLGATVLESPGMPRERLERGKGAWELYLKLAPDSAQRPQVEKGLEEMRAGLRGEGRLATAMAADGAAPPQDQGAPPPATK
ncbi:MAG: hypothetical protein IT383_17155 [Deltaproteobacteria bacterium]|nr:hypothetical protein [Deltaproteobacteria bacterium]